MTQWWNDDDSSPPSVAPPPTTEAPDVPHSPPNPPDASQQDLLTDRSSAPEPAYAPPPQLSGAQPSLLARSGANAMLIGAVSGIVAGLVGIGVGSLITESNDTAPGIVVGFVAATLGFLLNGWGHLSAGFIERGLRNGIIGGLVATAAGLAGLAIADTLFHNLGDGARDVTTERIALIIGWLTIGTLVGLGIGALQGVQKALSGFIGGAIGGLLGGLLFVGLDGTREVDRAMLIGALVAATVLGVAVGSVERFRRRAWANVLDGPLAGREFIFHRDRIVVGSAVTCDVALPGDAAVLPVHFTIDVGDSLIGRAEAGASVVVDGAPHAGGPLRDGAVVQVGSTFLEVHSR